MTTSSTLTSKASLYTAQENRQEIRAVLSTRLKNCEGYSLVSRDDLASFTTISQPQRGRVVDVKIPRD
jgi:hypothetical protein